jgi:hypothetical protein
LSAAAKVRSFKKLGKHGFGYPEWRKEYFAIGELQRSIYP